MKRILSTLAIALPLFAGSSQLLDFPISNETPANGEIVVSPNGNEDHPEY
ncbi:hypothetical protein QTG56_07345 [Rossellomorea sp. AcN35-11]|nr:hypothetical protein [Rossellomorea aquimaris]WJV30830.1 hypothetical protein QTG56_07345 [Rossellomorea sp. AcN35-11]